MEAILFLRCKLYLSGALIPQKLASESEDDVYEDSLDKVIYKNRKTRGRIGGVCT